MPGGLRRSFWIPGRVESGRKRSDEGTRPLTSSLLSTQSLPQAHSPRLCSRQPSGRDAHFPAPRKGSHNPRSLQYDYPVLILPRDNRHLPLPRPRPESITNTTSQSMAVKRSSVSATWSITKSSRRRSFSATPPVFSSGSSGNRSSRRTSLFVVCSRRSTVRSTLYKRMVVVGWRGCKYTGSGGEQNRKRWRGDRRMDRRNFCTIPTKLLLRQPPLFYVDYT